MDKKKWLIVIQILVLLLLIFIWGNSALPAKASSTLSTWLFNLLCRGKVTAFSSATRGWMTEGKLRKLMHGTEFMTLGILLSLEWKGRGWKSRRQFLLCLLTGLLVACCDEFIQIFNTRFASLKDVCIDFGGFLTGCILVWGICFWWKRWKYHA